MGFLSGLFGSKAEGTKKHICITGMTCENCVKHVETALKGVEGVKQVRVNLSSGQAQVVVAAQVTNEALTQAVSEEGYTVTRISDD